MSDFSVVESGGLLKVCLDCSGVPKVKKDRRRRKKLGKGHQMVPHRLMRLSSPRR